MKNVHIISILGLSSIALLAFPACNGGGSSSPSTNYSSSGAGSNNSSDTPGSPGYVYPSTEIGTNGDLYLSIGGGLYEDINNDQLGQDAGGIVISESISNGATKDTDLQKAKIQNADVTTRAQIVANRFQMSMSASVQLVQLSDRMKTLSQQGQVTLADRQAITQAGLAIANVSSDEVNRAIQQSMNGNDQAAEAVMSKAAKNLGMPSSANLRDQLLPALGIDTR